MATRLLESMVQAIQTETPAVKIVNVQRDDEAMSALLTRSGFEVYVRQYEMVLSI